MLCFSDIPLKFKKGFHENTKCGKFVFDYQKSVKCFKEFTS